MFNLTPNCCTAPRLARARQASLAAELFWLQGLWRCVAKGRVQIVGVVAADPAAQSLQEGNRTRELVDPNQHFLERAHGALCICVPFEVRVASERFIDAHATSSLHEAHCSAGSRCRTSSRGQLPSGNCRFTALFWDSSPNQPLAVC